ncbi:MAG TPA: hypothetical protein VLH18_05395 [Candidatus Limnocylindrales bacterium]|nr:hypothetical protein [Candidatus Limnocylindrales bacterium]
MNFKVKDQNIRHNGKRYRVGSTISFDGAPPPGIRHLLTAAEPVLPAQSKVDDDPDGDQGGDQENGSSQQTGDGNTVNDDTGGNVTDGNVTAEGTIGSGFTENGLDGATESNSAATTGGAQVDAAPSTQKQKPAAATPAKVKQKKAASKTKD